jgi:hypothetical protein
MGISGFRDGYLGTVSTKLGQRIDKIEWMNMYPKVNVYTHIQIYIYMEKPMVSLGKGSHFWLVFHIESM